MDDHRHALHTSWNTCAGFRATRANRQIQEGRAGSDACADRSVSGFADRPDTDGIDLSAGGRSGRSLGATEQNANRRFAGRRPEGKILGPQHKIALSFP